MWIFFVEQGGTRVYGEAYLMHAAAGKPLRPTAYRKKDHLMNNRIGQRFPARASWLAGTLIFSDGWVRSW